MKQNKISFYVLCFHCLLLCISATILSAQDQVKIDSLIEAVLNPNGNEKEKALINLQIAKEYYQFNRDTAFHFSFTGYRLAQEIDDDFLIAKALIQICLKDLNNGEYSEALNKLDQAEKRLIGISETLDNKEALTREKIVLFKNRGTAFNYLNEHKKAIENHLKAHSLAEEAHDQSEMSAAYYNIAVVHFSNQNYERAAYYQKRVVLSAEKNQDYFFLATGYSLGGAIHFYSNNLDSAKINATKAYEIAQENNLIQPSLESGNVLLAIFYQNEVYDSALYYSKELLSFSKRIQDSYYIASLTGSIAEIYSKLGDATNARFYFKEFETINEELNNLQLGKINYKNHADFEKSIGNHKEAYELLTKYVDIQDSIYTKENKQILTDLEAKYEAAQKDADLAEQQVVINKHKSQRNLFGIGGILSLLIGVVVWLRKKANDKIYKQQSELNNQKILYLKKENDILTMASMIEGQEVERKRIAQDLHDGLGGLLATIKVKFGIIQKELVELEQINVYDQTSRMIDDACSEVRKIAYNMMPGSLSKLGLIEAVKDISEYTPDIQIKIINLGLHPFTETKEIMLYRVIQEFISNTRKHAEAQQIIIQFSMDKNNSIIYLEDDGQGFINDEASIIGGLGLKSMKSRVNFIGGSFKIDSKIGIGTTCTIHIPNE